MTAEQFAYWLQGYSEIAGEAPNAEQWKVIQGHLQLVFNKVTPNRSGRLFPMPIQPAEWQPPHEVRCAAPQGQTATLC